VSRPDRLRRYESKDYTQQVQFPVEIIGRDNLVRRYAFEDAVRLYQRRVASAAARYGDPATVAAEVRHCRLRIDQLRRSFLRAAGLGSPAGDGVLAGPLAADVLSFLQRVLGAAEAEGALASLSPVATADHEAWWLPAPTGGGWLLYAFRVDGEGPAAARVSLDRTLRRLGAAATEPGAERLHVGRIGEDLALLLTGTEGWDGPSGLLDGTDDVEDTEAPADGWRRALGALRYGQLSNALRQFEAALDFEPARPNLARACAVVGLLADQPERAEFAARHGLLLGAGDPNLRYLLALALFRQGKAHEARGVLAAAAGGAPVLEALDALAIGSPVRTWRLARRAAASPTAEWFVRAAARSAGALALSALVARGCGTAAALLGAWLYASTGQALGVGAGVFAVAALLVGELRIRRLAAHALRAGRLGGVLLCPPEFLPASDDPARQ
jgi:hypothetical protein